MSAITLRESRPWGLYLLLFLLLLTAGLLAFKVYDLSKTVKYQDKELIAVEKVMKQKEELWAKAAVQIQKELNEEKYLREQADKQIAVLKVDKVELKKKLDVALGAIATLPPNELLERINAKIEYQASLRAGDRYDFTRRGAELTLGHFETGEFNLAMYRKSEAENEVLGSKVVSLEKSLTLTTQERNALFDVKVASDKVIAEQDKKLVFQAKDAKKKRNKGRLEGFAAGILLDIVLRLFGK